MNTFHKASKLEILLARIFGKKISDKRKDDISVYKFKEKFYIADYNVSYSNDNHTDEL